MSQSTHLDYRKDIDGLRAMAVIAVILFHAGLPVFRGGFIGVDVFFVISGYLITRLLITEFEQKSEISILNFYRRRCIRILPALLAVLSVSYAIAWQTLDARDMKSFSISAASVSVFSSNFLFWWQSGYFDTQAELKPLLHTWSLAVEEQFYIIFPMFFILLRRISFHAFVWSLIVLAAVSIAVSQNMVHNHPEAAYYMLPSRAWELLLGGLISAVHMRWSIGVRPPLAQLFSAAGTLAIVAAAIFFTPTTPFPGVHALLPTGGTALVLLFCEKGERSV